MVIFVTNRKLCNDDYISRLKQLAKLKPHAIILREKDLPTQEYELLAKQVQSVCEESEVTLIINQKIDVALRRNIPFIQLSMEDLRKYKEKIDKFKCVGASVHSTDEALEAVRLGAGYLIAGHIYPTGCKKGVQPRGLPFLRELCSMVDVPVFAIGGITQERINEVLEAGAKGVCIMSQAMSCSDPATLSVFIS